MPNLIAHVNNFCNKQSRKESASLICEQTIKNMQILSMQYMSGIIYMRLCVCALIKLRVQFQPAFNQIVYIFSLCSLFITLFNYSNIINFALDQISNYSTLLSSFAIVKWETNQRSGQNFYCLFLHHQKKIEPAFFINVNAQVIIFACWLILFDEHGFQLININNKRFI